MEEFASTASWLIFRRDAFRKHQWLDKLTSQRGKLNNKGYLLAKRFVDIALTIIALPILLPVFAIVAIAIKTEDPKGPIFFKQLRTGKGGRRFKMYKFRTMVANAEELKALLTAVNENGELSGPLKLKFDPRVTRVGRVLRKTSLDELPQIINIFKGEMSWVGPRPTSFGLQSYSLYHTARLDVQPGITGLWQLYGRGNTDFDNWLFWDSLYIENMSVWLDTQILVRTIFAVFGQRGAH